MVVVKCHKPQYFILPFFFFYQVSTLLWLVLSTILIFKELFNYGMLIW